MITVQSKDVASPLSLSVDTKSSKSDSGSFAALLHSLSSKSDSSAQNGALLLHLGDKKDSSSVKTSSKDPKEQTSKSDLLSLLKGDEQKSQVVNPDFTTAVDAKTLKSVMKDANNYLKNQIKETDAFKKGEIKDLPKTTQGLVALAKKVGIDVSSITVETVQTKDSKATQKTDAKSDLGTHSKIDTKKEDITNEDSTTKTQLPAKDDKGLQTAKTQSDKSDTLKTSTQQIKTDTQTTALTQTEQKTQTSKTDTSKDDKTLHVKSSEPQNENTDTSKQIQKQDPTLTQDESLKKIPLFVMPDETLTSHSTAELVDNKQTKAVQEQPATKVASPLSALLHGDKTSTTQIQSTDTKKDTKTETKSDSKIKTPSTVLSQLLHGENQQTVQTAEQTSSTKEDLIQGVSSTSDNSLHVSQTESDLSVKMNEAKQLTKYLAQDIKQAIDDYKPPFTRVKVKLNPEKLGEVDLTVVQRGKNVHVNISSNTAAINMLSQNAGDLKTQLTQNGMNNASLNFNSSTDTQSQQQQQQSGHQRESAKKAYEAFNQDETSEEILSSLEIVIPRYV